VYFNKNKKKILEKIRKEPNAQAKEIGHVCLTFLFVQGQIKSCMPFYFSQKELKQIMSRFLFKILAIRKVSRKSSCRFLDPNNYFLNLF
jgi:hypothetical protein